MASSRCTRCITLVASVALALLSACAEITPLDPPDTGEPGTTHDLSWLEAHAIPLTGTEAGTDLSDLEPLRQIVGDARIVALGEGTHGTAEFFRMKHRVVEFLVREMGFDAFAMEANWADTERMNEYVRTGQGDATHRLHNLRYWTWQTQEVLDLVHWMRAHNEAAGEAAAVGFYGFDMTHSAQAMDDVQDYILAAEGTLSLVGPAYTCWRIWNTAVAYASTAPETVDWCRGGVRAVYEHLAEHRDEFLAGSSPDAYERALRAARTVVQHEWMASRDWVGVESSPRERYMAENLDWLVEREGPDSRFVLWAHNAHVMDLFPWMGHYLRRTYGDDLVIVGFTFFEGSLTAVPLTGGQVAGPLTALQAPPAMVGSYESEFRRLEHPDFMVHLRPLRVAAPASAEWLLGPLPLRTIGAGYDPDRDFQYYWSTRLADQFDVVVNIRRSSATSLLPTPAD